MDLLLTRGSKENERVSGTLCVNGEFACFTAETGKLIPEGKYDMHLYIICDRYIDYEKFPWSESYLGQIPTVARFGSAICADGGNAGEYSDIVVVNDKGEPDERMFKLLMEKYFEPAKETGEKTEIIIKNYLVE